MIRSEIAASSAETGPRKVRGELQKPEGLSDQEDFCVRGAFMAASPSCCAHNSLLDAGK